MYAYDSIWRHIAKLDENIVTRAVWKKTEDDEGCAMRKFLFLHRNKIVSFMKQNIYTLLTGTAAANITWRLRLCQEDTLSRKEDLQ